MDLRTTQALWTLGLLSEARLSEAATSAMTDGMDSPSLRLLAGLGHAELPEAGALFERAMAELQLPGMEMGDAVRIYARQIAEEMVAGTIDPFVGARKIWWATLKVRDRAEEFDPFIYAESAAEDFPEGREFYAAAILDQARTLIAEQGREPDTPRPA